MSKVCPSLGTDSYKWFPTFFFNSLPSVCSILIFKEPEKASRTCKMAVCVPVTRSYCVGSVCIGSAEVKARFKWGKVSKIYIYIRFTYYLFMPPLQCGINKASFDWGFSTQETHRFCAFTLTFSLLAFQVNVSVSECLQCCVLNDFFFKQRTITHM